MTNDSFLFQPFFIFKSKTDLFHVHYINSLNQFNLITRLQQLNVIFLFPISVLHHGKISFLPHIEIIFLTHSPSQFTFDIRWLYCDWTWHSHCLYVHSLMRGKLELNIGYHAYYQHQLADQNRSPKYTWPPMESCKKVSQS